MAMVEWEIKVENKNPDLIIDVGVPENSGINGSVKDHDNSNGFTLLATSDYGLLSDVSSYRFKNHFSFSNKENTDINVQADIVCMFIGGDQYPDKIQLEVIFDSASPEIQNQNFKVPEPMRVSLDLSRTGDIVDAITANPLRSAGVFNIILDDIGLQAFSSDSAFSPENEWKLAKALTSIAMA